ncbi:tetratricopeptide (TPR) repeat protein [Sphingomonas jejuensis]|uniref:Tetratricopeptide (TPR) repeat protein n=1 Tax=Sphingomonas jejuensis TaxID=904715 RepID=A0ABX0XIL7_9SPHN|nr:tetratricopeptide repeat protein [Sphingomonas jejuensis]NJC32657.1 tetratricopeptide (TPR) repeat protein [Sphingomonas jejuensis]
MVARFLLPVGVLMLALAGTPILAQTPPPPGTVQSVERTVAADDLSRHLRTLSQNPENLEAALGAGDAALLLGDPNAAAGFFARAERIAVRDPRAKAGLGRAFLALERPRDALRLFDDATDLGLSPATIARERGFAFDLRGDPRRAQRDYQLALQQAPDAETTRRLALSLGISGERDRALALLEPLLYQRDAEAWRARAFVLAMTGDLPGAMAIVRQVMPAQGAAALEPYLRRLPSLRAADKAQAVHLGRFTAGRSNRQRPAEQQRPARTQPVPAAPQASTAPPAATTPAPAPAPAPAPTSVPTTTSAPQRAPAVTVTGRRTWVQLASGRAAGLPAEWRRLRTRAGSFLASRDAYIAAGTGGSGRLLVGPFDTVAAARVLVGQLGNAGVSSFAWTSAADAEVEPLQ